MNFKGGFPVMSALLLLFVTQAYSDQLMCYVCDNCAQITVDTPQFLCDASYFATTGPTLPSTMTTSEEPATTTPLATSPSTMEASSSTTTPPSIIMSSSTTTEAPTTVTEEASTGTPADTTSTEAPVPTPPTIGPPNTTTAMPTPTNQGTVIIPVDSVTAQMNAVALAENATTPATPAAANATKTYVPSSELRVRQTRRAVETDVSYHCYRVQRSDNGTLVSDRGCSRVTADQGVCPQLQLASNTSDKLNKCFACSTKLCNGSSALSVSALALLVGVVAAILRH